MTTLALQTQEEHKAVYGTVAASLITIEEPKLDERVENGCALLDRDYPGWASKISLRTFNISSTNCVIGQVFGDYDKVHDVIGVDRIDEVVPEEEYYGFNLCSYDEVDDDDRIPEWKSLQSSWLIAIAERQFPDKVEI